MFSSISYSTLGVFWAVTAPKQILISVLLCLLLNSVFYIVTFLTVDSEMYFCLAPSANLIDVPFCSSSRRIVKMWNKVKLNAIMHGTLWRHLPLSEHRCSLLLYLITVLCAVLSPCEHYSWTIFGFANLSWKSPSEEYILHRLQAAPFQHKSMLCASQFDVDL